MNNQELWYSYLRHEINVTEYLKRITKIKEQKAIDKAFLMLDNVGQGTITD